MEPGESDRLQVRPTPSPNVKRYKVREGGVRLDPTDLTCAIRGKIFRRPHVASTGQAYEMAVIRGHCHRQAEADIPISCPLTGANLEEDEDGVVQLMPVQTLQNAARAYALRTKTYMPPTTEAALLDDVDKAIAGDPGYLEAISAAVDDHFVGLFTDDRTFRTILQRIYALAAAEHRSGTRGAARQIYNHTVACCLAYPEWTVIHPLLDFLVVQLLDPPQVALLAALLGAGCSDVDGLVRDALVNSVPLADGPQLRALLDTLNRSEAPARYDLMQAVVSQMVSDRPIPVEALTECYRTCAILTASHHRWGHNVANLAVLLKALKSSEVTLPPNVVRATLMQPKVVEHLEHRAFKALQYQQHRMTPVEWTRLYTDAWAQTEGAAGPSDLLDVLCS